MRLACEHEMFGMPHGRVAVRSGGGPDSSENVATDHVSQSGPLTIAFTILWPTTT